MRIPPSHFATALNEVRQDFAAAKSSRFQRRRTGIPSAGAGADYHYRTEADWLKLIEYARDMDRNDCVVGQTIDRAVLNTVQGGFTLDVNSGDTFVDDELWNRWDEFTTNPDECDVSGERTFSELEFLSLRSVFVDGDVIAVGRDDGRLQVYEAHRCRTPYGKRDAVIHGIELDEQRRRIAFHICKEDIDPAKQIRIKNEFERVEARDKLGNRRVMQLRLARRLSQTRGITALAPCFDLGGMHDDIEFAAALKQQVSACFVIFRKKSDNWQGGAGSQFGERATENRRDGSTRTVENITPALEYEGDPGEDFQGFSPQVISGEFLPHVRQILTLIGVNLGVPLVMMLLDAKETNFSGWRGAVDQARMGFRHNQKRMIATWHRPIFQWKVTQWASKDSSLMRAIQKLQENRPKGMASDQLWIRHDWHPPQWPYIDPKGDREADSLDVGNCLATSREVDARNGRDFFKKVDRIIEERVYAVTAAKRAAAKLNIEFPSDNSPVRWDQLFSFPSASGQPGAAESAPTPAPTAGAKTENA